MDMMVNSRVKKGKGGKESGISSADAGRGSHNTSQQSFPSSNFPPNMNENDRIIYRRAAFESN